MNKYEAILKEIITLCYEYEITTGVKPTRLYIGRKQQYRIKQWCYYAGYIDNAEEVFGEGNRRPELMGLPVYIVNAEDHMCCN